MNALSATKQILLSLLSNALFNIPIEIPSNVDWQAVICEAKDQAVLPLVFHETNILPDELHAVAKKQQLAMIANNIRIESNHLYTHQIMNDAGIPYVILKGYSSAHYYPDPIFRTMGDVDFLVAKENLDAADEALRKNEFQPWDKNHICHIVYRKPGMHLELHWEPSGMPEGVLGEIVRSYLDNIFETAVEVNVDSDKIMLPDDFHHGLILLLHTCHHLTDEGVGLRHLCDWAVFVNSLSDDLFRTLFEKKLKAIGLWRFAQLLTQLSSKYLRMPEKKWANENIDDALLYAMICDLFHGGNFGVKDNCRQHEAMLISPNGKNTAGHPSMLKQFIFSMNHIIYTNWPVSIEFKFLVPFGWIFYGFRYVFRVIIGKRDKPNITKTVSSAKERRELYKAFHLYEI